MDLAQVANECHRMDDGNTDVDGLLHEYLVGVFVERKGLVQVDPPQVFVGKSVCFEFH